MNHVRFISLLHFQLLKQYHRQIPNMILENHQIKHPLQTVKNLNDELKS